MRILVISDIHSNLTALNAVLADAGSIDAAWCLGDTVGYGPDPNECIDRLRGLSNLTCLIGNHDAACVQLIDLNAFNREAKLSARWTQTVLLPENREYLIQLPERVKIEGITLTHGSPRSPVWEYLLDPLSAFENLVHFQTDLCFIGHTHIPLFFHQDLETGKMVGEIIPHDTRPKIEGRMYLNPGSVGQPRDHDSRAAYAIFDSEKMEWHSLRISYDIEDVQERMRQASLPSRLIHRLAEGW
ncbi:MAG: metallophosphoesterase family protein [Saprospiraceae bacterium]|nr:metallophosphoesterase family protein [Saprospiraceae bacterium]